MMRYAAKAGEFVGGVPARDLTDDEWTALPEELRALALALGLYRSDEESAAETPMLAARKHSRKGSDE